MLIGLTGGIAAGKSTVATVWESLGATVIDADVLAREVVEPGTVGLSEVARAFPGVVVAGVLDRKKLGDQVFADPKRRVELEGILHPLIQQLSRERIEAAATSVVVYVVPLLVEAKVTLPFDKVVTVEAPEPDQIARMVKNRAMTEAEAKSRIAAQAKPAERANHADYILNSNQDLELLRRDARLLYESLTA